tara:strand:- start:355 stop:966 length:612 start_codon:yes stop_codon:yes gene_type:complete
MIKRIFDLLVSVLLIVLLSPLFLIIITIVAYDLGSPYFFVQQRPGFKNKIFKFIKFRTMNNSVDSNGRLLPDSERLTNIGSFLRKSSLDELPNLFNVLMGNMSIVGPRPLLAEYLDLYNDRQLLRHTVKPGITGWAQIKGRNSLSWTDKLEYDIWYVKNQTFWLDLKIIIITLPKVFLRQDIKYRDLSTMYKFKGNNEKKHEI